MWVAIFATGMAQTIENGDFEAWTSYGDYSDADGWASPNADFVTMGQTLVDPDDTDPFSGSYNAYLETKNFGFFTLCGAMTNGDYVAVPMQGSYIAGGVPFTDRPTFLNFMYKCEPGADDNCYVGITLFNQGNMVGKAVFTNTNTVSTWTAASLAIDYQSSDAPDTMQIIITSSNYTLSNGFMDGGVVGSKLWIDDLHFVTENVDDLQVASFQLFPNPTVSKINIEFPDKHISAVEILSSTGQVVANPSFTAGSDFVVDVEELPTGVYYIRLSDGQSSWVKRFVKP